MTVLDLVLVGLIVFAIGMDPPGGPPGPAGVRGQSAPAPAPAPEAASAVVPEEITGPADEHAVTARARTAIPAITPNLPRVAM
ncbi:hypothetical protein ACFRKD_18305 [Streptomyces niveus]|uniref:hypothetical protein n=1 Tax=Streptomyces niveus TaxID=193462 RepID=UPI0036B62737